MTGAWAKPDGAAKTQAIANSLKNFLSMILPPSCAQRDPDSNSIYKTKIPPLPKPSNRPQLVFGLVSAGVEAEPDHYGAQTR
jgi:hypothetical protein